jgi:hypothetical protein
MPCADLAEEAGDRALLKHEEGEHAPCDAEGDQKEREESAKRYVVLAVLGVDVRHRLHFLARAEPAPDPRQAALTEVKHVPAARADGRTQGRRGDDAADNSSGHWTEALEFPI